jgi:hypothetical protein
VLDAPKAQGVAEGTGLRRHRTQKILSIARFANRRLRFGDASKPKHRVRIPAREFEEFA